MQTPSPSEVEQRFGADPGRATFPLFCNALISHEAPPASTFPVLTSKSGPDGGIDGEWDLTQADSFEHVSIARRGWNIYQFKTVDPAASGAKKAVADLCGQVRGAVAEVIARSVEKKAPALYVLLTNLQLGPETQSTTRAKSRLNTNRARLRASLLEGAPESVEIQIIDAAQIVGLVERHPALRLSWFSPQVGTTWEEMHREERTILPAAPELIGRKEELADLHRWLEDKETRVIAMSGPNSVGKTRLCIEATRRFAPITLFVKDAAAVRQAGLAVLADPRRPVIIVAEDPPLELVEPLAKQAVSALYSLKLIITIPSPATAPVVKLNPDERVKETSIKAVPRHVAEEIIKAVNANMDNNVRGWIIQQAGGIPGVLVAAADMGNELRLKAGSLRDQLLRRFCQRLLSRADREALHIVQVLSPFVYVDTTDPSPELQTLLAAVGLTMTVAGVRRRLADLEKLGYAGRRDSACRGPARTSG